MIRIHVNEKDPCKMRRIHVKREGSMYNKKDPCKIRRINIRLEGSISDGKDLIINLSTSVRNTKYMGFIFDYLYCTD